MMVVPPLAVVIVSGYVVVQYADFQAEKKTINIKGKRRIS